MQVSNDQQYKRAIVAQLAEYVAAVPAMSLPSQVVDKTKCHILNTVACMVAGTQLKPGQSALRLLDGRSPDGATPIIGTGLKTSPELAAFINGMTARAGESDDVHARSRTHPGASIVPAALAMAHSRRATGKLLVDAVCAGYDVGCRIPPALGVAQLEDRGFGPQSIGQLWGASVAAAVLAGIGQEALRYLFSYTAQQCGGMQSWYYDKEHVEQSFFMGGMPARDGYWAAWMTAQGFTANPDVFSGRYNFLDTFSDRPLPDEVLDRLGERYEIMETNLKRWHFGSPSHASLEALLHIRGEHGLTADDIEHVVAEVPSRDGVIGLGRNSPTINFHYLMAIAMLEGGVSYEASLDFARMQTPDIKELMGRIEMKLSDALQKEMPNRTAIVHVTTRDRRTYTKHVNAVLGTPVNPMASAQHDEVCMELMEPVLGKAGAQNLVAAVHAIDQMDNLDDVWRLMSGG
jgi:2-methylcitrate dehydratase PrpD